MANSSKNLMLSERMVREKKGMVILPLLKYEKMRKKIRELEREKRDFEEQAKVLRIIAEGEREYRGNKLKAIRSISEIY